jgi:hypothetical protein
MPTIPEAVLERLERREGRQMNNRRDNPLGQSTTSSASSQSTASTGSIVTTAVPSRSLSRSQSQSQIKASYVLPLPAEAIGVEKEAVQMNTEKATKKTGTYIIHIPRLEEKLNKIGIKKLIKFKINKK